MGFLRHLLEALLLHLDVAEASLIAVGYSEEVSVEEVDGCSNNYAQDQEFFLRLLDVAAVGRTRVDVRVPVEELEVDRLPDDQRRNRGHHKNAGHLE